MLVITACTSIGSRKLEDESINRRLVFMLHGQKYMSVNKLFSLSVSRRVSRSLGEPQSKILILIEEGLSSKLMLVIRLRHVNQCIDCVMKMEIRGMPRRRI